MCVEKFFDLIPGAPLHLTARLLHEVHAVEDSTVMVTILTGEKHNPAQDNLEGVSSF